MSAPAVPSEDFYPLLHNVVQQLDGLRKELTTAVHQNRQQSLQVLQALSVHLTEVAQQLPPPKSHEFERFYAKLTNSTAWINQDANMSRSLLAQVANIPTSVNADTLATVRSQIDSVANSWRSSAFLDKLNQAIAGHSFFLLHQRFAALQAAEASASSFYGWLKMQNLVPEGCTMEHVRSLQLFYDLVATYPRILYSDFISVGDILDHRSALLRHFLENPAEGAKFQQVPASLQSLVFDLQQSQVQAGNAPGQVQLLVPVIRPAEADMLKKITNVLRIQDMQVHTHFAAWAQDPAADSEDALLPRVELFTEVSINPAAKSTNYPAPAGVHVQLLNYVTATQPPQPTKPQPAKSITGDAVEKSASILKMPPSEVSRATEQVKKVLGMLQSAKSPEDIVPTEALKKRSVKTAAAAAAAADGSVPAPVSSFVSSVISNMNIQDGTAAAKIKNLPVSIQYTLLARALHGALSALTDPSDFLASAMATAAQLEVWKVDNDLLQSVAKALSKSIRSTPEALVSNEAADALDVALKQLSTLIGGCSEAGTMQVLQGKAWKHCWGALGLSSLELHSLHSPLPPKKIELKKLQRVCVWTKSEYARVEPPTPYCLVLVPLAEDDNSEESSGESEDSSESVSALTRFLCFSSDVELKWWRDRIGSRVEALAVSQLFGAQLTKKASKRIATTKTPSKTKIASKSSSASGSASASPMPEKANSTPKVRSAKKMEIDISESSDSDSEASLSSSLSKSASKGPSTSTPGSNTPNRSVSNVKLQAGKMVEDVLRDDTLYVAFRKYLQDRQSAENLLFFKAAHNYKSARKNGLKGNGARERAEDVYDKFLSPSADQQITLAPKTVETIESLLYADADPPADLYMAAANEISHLVLEVQFNQFLPTFKPGAHK